VNYKQKRGGRNIKRRAYYEATSCLEKAKTLVDDVHQLDVRRIKKLSRNGRRRTYEKDRN
jgi:hypothetical protein